MNKKNLIILTVIISLTSIFSSRVNADSISDLCKSDCKMEAQFLKKYAKEGSSLAEFSLSILYFQGIGVEQNIKVAKRLLQNAAKAGEPGAQYQLGYFLLNGLYYERDLETAKHWLTRAANKHTLDSRKLLKNIEFLKQQTKSTLKSAKNVQLTNQKIIEKTNRKSDFKNIEQITVVLHSDYQQILDAAEAQTCTHKSCGPQWTMIIAPLIKLKN